MTGNGSNGTTQACAACKYQRRKCSPECPLAPYFPPDQPKQFLNVHRLFGVSNTLRILKQVHESKRNDAMKSILYEADARDRDPVHGCYGVVTVLQNQAEILRDELEFVRTQIHLLEQQQTLAYYNLNQQYSLPLAGTNQMINNGSSLTHVPAGNWQLYPHMQTAYSSSPPSPPATSPQTDQQQVCSTTSIEGDFQNLCKPTVEGLSFKSDMEVKPSFDTRQLAADSFYSQPPTRQYSDYQQETSSIKDNSYDESSAESCIKDSQSLEHEELASAAALFTLTANQN